MRWGVSVTTRPLSTPGKDTVPTLKEAGWAPGPVWTGAENLAPTGSRSPGRPARSQSLYRLSYPAHLSNCYGWIFDDWILLEILNSRIAAFCCYVRPELWRSAVSSYTHCSVYCKGKVEVLSAAFSPALCIVPCYTISLRQPRTNT
jgi:hypothetical protein